MIGDLSQLRFVGLMRQVHGAQAGFVDIMQTPDVSSSVGSYTLKNAQECPCMQHPFDFAKSKVITTPLDIETLNRVLKSRCKMLVLSCDTVGYIKYDGDVVDKDTPKYSITLKNRRCKIDTAHLSYIKCVVMGPEHILMKDIRELPYCLYGCTKVHYSYPNHNKMCRRACMVACRHPSVARMYAQMYIRTNLSLSVCPDALKINAKEHMMSFVAENMGEFVSAWVPYESVEAAMLIRECAWAVQRLIMIGMNDSDCMWSWVPKDVCKLIHRMVFST
jgi:hypothetical protein